MLRTRRPVFLAFEQLETRENPAGTITATFAGGSLTLVGDAADNALNIFPAADGRLTLSGVGTLVSLNGAPPVNSVTLPNLLTGTIKASLGAGSDSIQLTGTDLPGLLSINGGSGNNTVDLNHVHVRGGVSIVHGAGFDTTHLRGSLAITGGLNIASGPGGSRIDGDATTDLQVARALNIAGGSGDDSLILNGAIRIHAGRVQVTGGGGTNTTEINTVRDLTASTSIRVSGGAFLDSVRLHGGTLAVGGGVGLSLGAGSNSATITAGGGGLSVGGSINMVSAAGTDSVSIGTPDSPTAIGGGVSLSPGSGGGSFMIQGNWLTIGGSLVMTAGAGTDNLFVVSRLQDGLIGGSITAGLGAGDGQSVFIQAPTTGTILSVGGALRVATADNTPATGGDVIALQGVSVRGPTSVTTAAGADTIVVNDSTFAAFSISTAAGADVVQIERGPSGGTTRFAGAVRVNTGDDNDSVLVGANVANVSQAVFATTNIWNGGVGNADSLVLQSTGNIFLVPATIITGFENVT